MLRRIFSLHTRPISLCSTHKKGSSYQRGITQLNNPHAIAASEYIAMVNADDCTGCGVCSDERCPSDAIELVKRERAPKIPNTMREMGLIRGSPHFEADTVVKCAPSMK